MIIRLVKFIILIFIFKNLNAQKVNVLMPNVTTTEDDYYMCISYKIADDQSFIVGIEPLTNMSISHHMFAFGCERPVVSTSAWNCGSNVCLGEKNILFAWGRNAPALNLPNDVAFKVGSETKYRYIVVNIHYLKKVNEDQSGLSITFSNQQPKYLAGIMLMVNGNIHLTPHKKKYHADISCSYKGPTVNVFAFRVHTHSHGDVNTAYRVRTHKWTQLAKGDPQLPQAFYPTESIFDLKDDDILIGRCSYHNDEERTVYAGPTHLDEMCNIYLMYYSDGEDTVQDLCSSNTYPQLENIIPEEADIKPVNLQNENKNINHHDMEGGSLISKYTLIDNWYDASKIKFGQVGGIAIDSNRGNIIIFHRGSQKWDYDTFNKAYQFNLRKYSAIKEDTILVINSNTGNYEKSWGGNTFFMPHGINIDSSGNVWLTDVGRHQVFKYNYNNTAEPEFEVGVRNVPGNDQTHFCQPSDVAVLKNGEFYVSDGYCNSRIVKFDKNGKYLFEWSSEERGLPGHFFIPHALALHEANNLICVADRENFRVQCFDLRGNYMHQSVSTEFGPVYSVSFASNNGSILYALNGENTLHPDVQFEKKVFLIQVTNGDVIGSINLDQDKLNKPHNIKLTADASEIYISNLNPPQVVKYVLMSYNVGNVRKNNKTTGNMPKPVKIDNIDVDKDNFRTSMFIMAFLAIPLSIVVISALFVRFRNMGKFRNIGPLLNNAKQSDLGRWMKSTKKNKNNRGGFTRLNQESDNEGDLLNDNVSSDSDEITVPLSKA